MTYKIRYGVIDPHCITNKIEPNEQMIEEMNAANGWFRKLETSILEEGFRNPINVWAHENLIEPRYGGSRLYIAQKHNLHIPAIISDHADRFPDLPVIGLPKAWKMFTDPPRKLYPTARGLNISGCPDVHLKLTVDT